MEKTVVFLTYGAGNLDICMPEEEGDILDLYFTICAEM